MNYIAPVSVLVVGLALSAAYYLFGSFTYEFNEGGLVMRRKILGGIPFGSRALQFSDVKEVRRFGGAADWWRGADVYGRLFLQPGVLVIMRKGAVRRIYITPSQPDEFIRKLQAVCQVAPLNLPSEQRPKWQIRGGQNPRGSGR